MKRMMWAVMVLMVAMGGTAWGAAEAAGTTEGDGVDGRLPAGSASGKVALMAKIGDGVVFGLADVTYNLGGRAVTTVAVSLPEDVTVDAIRGQFIKGQREDVAEGRRVITVTLDRKVTGVYVLYLEFERVSREEGTVTVPLARPEGMNVVEGYIGVTAIQSLEVTDQTAENVRQIDPSQLRGLLFTETESPVQRAYSYTWVREVGKEPTLTFTLVRHEDVTVKDAFIDEARYLSLLRPEGFYVTKAVFSIRNKNHQSLRLTLPPDSELWSAFLADQPVPVVKDEEGRLLIALPQSELGEGDLINFPVEVVFETKLDRLKSWGRIKVPLPQTDITVGKARWHLYLPTAWTYRGIEGNVGEPVKDLHPEKDIADDLSKFALGLSGNFLKFQAKAKQSESKTNLGAIFTTETAYHKKNGTYASTFRDLDWAPEGRNAYTYIIGRDRINNALGRPELAAIDATAVGRDGFLALAVGNIDNDPFPDIWGITQEQELINLANDATDTYDPRFEAMKAGGWFSAGDIEALQGLRERMRASELRGMLSIKIEVPAEGKLVRFEKLFPAEGETELAVLVKYMPETLGRGALFLGRLLALAVAALAVVGLAVLVRRHERLAIVRRHWWLTVLVVLGVMLIVYRLWLS